MSLFYIDEADELNELVEKMSHRQYQQSPGLYHDLPERAKKFMKRDFYYGISYLYTAIKLRKEAIFTSYVRWTYDYLAYLMTYVSRETMTKQVIDFYEAMRGCLVNEMEESEYALADEYLNHSIELIQKMGKDNQSQDQVLVEDSEVKEYLDMLLNNQTKEAINYFQRLGQNGYQIDKIYTKIMQTSMHCIGELWFENKINVAQEHYATVTTQMAMSQLYPTIFATPSNGYTMIGCCMGGELHEMGMRAITDLFTYYGFNSIFLGAGVPLESLVQKIDEQKPSMVALSVTMPQHLSLCRDTIMEIRRRYPELAVAVGGRAFQDLDGEWKQWGADIYTKDAEELIQWTCKRLNLNRMP